MARDAHSSSSKLPRPRPDEAPGSVWLRGAAPARARRTLSREAIVIEAVALLDEQGIDRLTMRRLAERLNVTSTALYWHVNTKEDVLDLAFDHIFGSVEIPPLTDDWHSAVRTLLRRWRAAMLAHPWATTLVDRPMLGPNALARTEFLYAVLAGTGLTGTDLTATAQLLANYVIGTAAVESTWHRSQADPKQQSLARRRITDDEERYPTLHKAGHLDEQQASADELFEHNLGKLITCVITSQ
ncbi:TetR/AcrR family transcriptional regulator C-terminal domain-containing protein [Brevibacterium samyangense]